MLLQAGLWNILPHYENFTSQIIFHYLKLPDANTSFHPKTQSQLLLTLTVKSYTRRQIWIWMRFCDNPSDPTDNISVISRGKLDQNRFQAKHCFLNRWMEVVDLWMNSLHKGTLLGATSKQPVLLTPYNEKMRTESYRMLQTFWQEHLY